MHIDAKCLNKDTVYLTVFSFNIIYEPKVNANTHTHINTKHLLTSCISRLPVTHFQLCLTVRKWNIKFRH